MAGPYIDKPVFANDGIYFASDDSGSGLEMQAINAKTGNTKKQLIKLDAFGFRISDDYIYYLDSDGQFHKADLDSGKDIKIYPGIIDSFGDCIALGNKLIIEDCDCRELSCYNAETFKLQWKYSSKEGISNDVVTDGKVICFSEGSNASSHISSIDIDSGKELWSFKIGNIADHKTGLIHGDILYVGSEGDQDGLVANGALYALNINTGQQIWCCKPSDQSGVSSEIAFSNDTLFFGSANGTYFAVDAKSGHEIWKYAIPEQSSINFIYATANDESVYFAQFDGMMYAFNSEDGKVQWKNSSFRKVSSIKALNGLLYVGLDTNNHIDSLGSLFALNQKDGTTKWKQEIK
ncbi:MAG: PQQ-binding-like beta-propeller repeat protein [Rubrobacteridae bacterium]|nr:PQQ-binding-like beta-propeller repeat protein [Rubrobacteridae bacterium]